MSENSMFNSPNQTSILAEFAGLRDQIGQWATKNFDVHLPELGVAEEVGELTHAVLKREQKIRGEASNKTQEEIVDALGDAAVYMLHLAYMCKITPGYAHSLVGFKTEFELLGAMHRTAGQLILHRHYFNDGQQYVLLSDWCLMFALLSDFAEMHNYHLLNLSKSVWADVSKRDWRKFPHNGLTQ